MGILRPQKIFALLFVLSGSLLAQNQFQEPTHELSDALSDELWSPSLDLSSSENSLFDEDLSLNEEYHFPWRENERLNLFSIAEEPNTSSPYLPELAPTTPSLNPNLPPTVPGAQPANATQVPGAPTAAPPTPAPVLPVNQPRPTPIPPVPRDASADNTKGILINFNDVSAAEFVRFISRVTNRNFIFDESQLQFHVTIVSEEPTSVENMMTALMQILRVHGLSLIEQGNNILIHSNNLVSQISNVVADSLPQSQAAARNAEIITRVFRLNTLDPERAAVILAPLVSEGALIEVLQETSHIIVTDLATNVAKIGELLRSLDAPNSGLVMGQYVVVNALLDSLIDLAERVMAPIAENKPLVFVPHPPSNSVFVVSTPFLVDRALAVLNTLDINVGQTRIFGAEALKFTPGARREAEATAAAARAAAEAAGAAPRAAVESTSPWTEGLPPGHIERTKFYIHKLRYRRGEGIVDALGRVGFSLMESGTGNLDLISSIQSIQWLEGSNSLVFTGTAVTIAKVRELIDEIDTPLRQVFLEMLILETDLDESLNLGVNFATRFATPTASGAEAFLSRASALPGTLDEAVPGVPFVDPSQLARTLGFNLGIIGRNINFCGTEFSSIGALVNALHDKQKSEVIMNPRLLVEDNATAEIFVGFNTPFQTQTIVNDQGSIITNNVEFRDVGTRMKITPLISNTDIITLDILEEVSSIVATSSITGSLSSAALGPSTRTSKTTTKVHVPNKFFLVMSGMIQEVETRLRSQVPCLGGVPLLGALFSENDINKEKRNLMIFIRPQIIDTEEDIDNLTRHQQDIYRDTSRTKKMWKDEVDETLILLNVKEPETSLHDTEEFNP